jgi:hypothetical protein
MGEPGSGRMVRVPGIMTARRLWAAAMSLSLTASVFLMEPLITLGPAALALLFQPELAGVIVLLLVLVGLARLGRLAAVHLASRWRARRPYARDPADG